jgi:16S rRNA (adenine1518-N6/adenine1519-N6)-dimethyltransferase
MISEPVEWLSPQKVLRSLGFNPLRSLGQNFMMDKGVLRFMVEKSDLSEGDAVIEVGPGTGALTQFLLAQPIALTCVEIDKGLSQYLKTTYEPSGLSVIHGDILHKKREIHQGLLAKVDELKLEGREVKWISNLPYNILTPFLWNLLAKPEAWDSGLFLVQKEFIDRLKAMPGAENYSPLSVVSHLYLDVAFLRNVGKGCFWPSPEVESAILEVIPRENLTELSPLFIEFLKTSFSQRRKVLSKLLKSKYHGVKDHLISLGLNDDVRAESLGPEMLLRVFTVLENAQST